MRIRYNISVLFIAGILPSACLAQTPPPGLFYKVYEPSLSFPKDGEFKVTMSAALTSEQRYSPPMIGYCNQFSERAKSNEADLEKTKKALAEKLKQDIHECVGKFSKLGNDIR